MEERFTPVPPAESRPMEATAAPGKTGSSAGGVTDPRALQILSTEHWSLLTARSLVYNEAFARGGMFLAVLSATLVALGLISTATGFSDAFLIVAVVVLGLDFFIGLASLGRIMTASTDDLLYLQGMNRLRHAYFEIVPGLEPYFITSGFDDFDSVIQQYGGARESSRLGQIFHGLTTMPGMISVICCGLVGMLAAVAALLLTHDAPLAGVIGLAVGFGSFAFMTTVVMRSALGFARSMAPRFPRPAPPAGRPDVRTG
jgi:hypothetical protein